MGVLQAIAAIPKIADALTQLVGAVSKLGKEIHASQRRKEKDALVEEKIAEAIAAAGAAGGDGVRKPKAKQRRKPN